MPQGIRDLAMECPKSVNFIMCIDFLSNYYFRDEIDNPTKEKKIEKLSLMEHTRLKNMAICKRKLPQNLSLQDLVKAINALDIKTLNMDTVELLQRMVPVDDEIKKYREYTSAGM